MVFQIFSLILSALSPVLTLLVPLLRRLIPDRVSIQVKTGEDTYSILPQKGKEGVLNLMKIHALHADRLKLAMDRAFLPHHQSDPLDKQIVDAQRSMMKSLNALDTLLQGWPSATPPEQSVPMDTPVPSAATTTTAEKTGSQS